MLGLNFENAIRKRFLDRRTEYCCHWFYRCNVPKPELRFIEMPDRYRPLNPSNDVRLSRVLSGFTHCGQRFVYIGQVGVVLGVLVSMSSYRDGVNGAKNQRTSSWLELDMVC